MVITDRLRRHAQRARARGAPHRPYTEDQVFAKTRGHCHICRRPVERASFQIDHLLPIARGGPDTLDNVAPAHAECNRRKSARVTHLPDGPLRRALIQTFIAQARLARVGVRAFVGAPTIAPHIITLRLVPAPGHAHLDARALAEVRATVNHPAARVYTHGAELRVEIPRWPRRIVPLATMPAAGLRFGVGVEANNQVVAIDLSASPHVLVAGQTRSGKSEALRAIVYHLARAGSQLVLVDADGATFDPFARARGLVCRIARDVDEAHDAVALAHAMMDKRPVDTPQAPLALVIDEAHMLAGDTRELVIDMAKRGAKRATQVVVATHRPTRDVLPKQLTDQLTWAIAGRVQDVAGSRVILGRTGAETLQGHGDMIVAHAGCTVRIQAALGGASDWAKLEQAAEEPPRAPETERAEDARYARKSNAGRVEWLIERFRETGAAPSQYALNQAFGGNAARNSRAADEARQLLNLTA